MNNAPNWLEDVIVVNESGVPDVAGDVQIYRNEGDLGRQLEDWYVHGVEYLALTGTGEKAILGLRGKLVIVESREKFPEGSKMLLGWLAATAQHILAVRTAKAGKGKTNLGVLEAKGVLPESVEGLIAYVGFHA